MVSAGLFQFNIKRLSKTLFHALVLLAFAVSVFATLPARAESNPLYASFVMDASTGAVLHQRYADKKLHPASLTKVMTLLMLFDAMSQGRVGLDDRIRISNYAASMQPSKIGLSPGSTIRVQDAIYALVTKSANDIAVAVAEHLSGSERAFAEAMTERARNIGMSRTTFRNASGLHNPQQISTARDMAKMAHFVITRYPEYYRFFSRQSFTYAGQTFRNHNKLMASYDGMDGMKTGFISASGFNLVASAVRGNKRLIGVVFGGRTSQSRNAHMASLLDNGFAQLGVTETRVANAGASSASQKSVTLAGGVPIPQRKPGSEAVLASATNKIAPASGEAVVIAGLTRPEPVFKGHRAAVDISEMGGQGDYDPEDARKAYMKTISRNSATPAVKPVLAAYTPEGKRSWSIQVGAFRNKAQTDAALEDSKRKLPAVYASAAPVVAPLKTPGGWLFRARLTGFDRAQAFDACRHLRECMPIAP